MKWKDVLGTTGQLSLCLCQTNEERIVREAALKKAKEESWLALLAQQKAERDALVARLESTRHDRAQKSAAIEAFEHEIFEAHCEKSPVKPGNTPN